MKDLSSTHALTDVLVIEDHEPVQKMLRMALEGSGYSVMTATDGRKGLALLSTNRFRMVVTDVLMPNMDGLEFIMSYQKVHPKIPILAISGGGSLGSTDHVFRPAKLFGCERTLAKPFTLPEFLAAVEEVLARASPLAPESAGKM
jgi:CheY-like chemotaxis protein